MKPIFILFLSFMFLTTPLYAADQWDKTDPAGSSNVSDLDTNITANNAAIDRLVKNYRFNAAVVANSVSSLQVLAGELAIPNSDASVIRFRTNPSATSVTWSDIDTGAEASSTTYYVWALADADATTFTIKISTSSSAPSGATYYRKIGTFYNNSSSDIVNVYNTRNDDGADYPDVVKGWIHFNGSGTIAINDSYNVSSITDNGTGDYTITWTTAFASAYYAVAVTSAASTSVPSAWHIVSQSTTAVRIITSTVNNNGDDPTTVCLIALGDRL